jgi:hypothetical protein
MDPVIGTVDGPDTIAVHGTATGERSLGVRGDGQFAGVFGASTTGEGVHAHSESPKLAALAAFNINADGDGVAVFGEKKGDKGLAGLFIGSVRVTRTLLVEGDVELANAADFAEDFDVADATEAEPGTVLVLGDDERLRPCDKPYDKRVVGVVSGAGPYRPGIVLDRRPGPGERRSVALLGKVYCKVDAGSAPVEVGDLLTTSPVAGHAMAATDPYSALGAVIGKALRALPAGRQLIPVLVTLQ